MNSLHDKMLRAVAAMVTICLCSSAQPTKTRIIEQMRRVNDYWLESHLDYGTNQWDRATYYSGLLPLYKTLNERHYYDYAVNWGTLHTWGLNGGITTRNADNQCAGQAYIALYEIEPAALRISAISQCIDLMVNSARIDDWWWIDALHMAPPVIAALGRMNGNTAYYDKLYAMYSDIKVRRRLWDTTDYLWFRDSTFLPPNLTPNGRHIHWSRGNGWVFAGLAKILSILPQNAPGRTDYVTVFRQMAGTLKSIQRSDGFWNSSLVDPNHYGGPEASGTAFFTFGMAWGINNGVLSDTGYLPVVIKAWNALNSVAVHPDGILGYCQPIAAGPGASTYNDTKDYAVGAFALGGCELLRLVAGNWPDTANLAFGRISAFSSQQTGNEAANAVDGSLLTRWSAQVYPQWIEIDLGSVQSISSFEVHAFENRAYLYTLQGKQRQQDGYTMIVDSSDNATGGKQIVHISPAATRYLRLTISGAAGYTGDWISIADFRVFGSSMPAIAFKEERSNPFQLVMRSNGIISLNPGQPAKTLSAVHCILYSLSGRAVFEKAVSFRSLSPVAIDLHKHGPGKSLANGAYLLKVVGLSAGNEKVAEQSRLFHFE